MAYPKYLLLGALLLLLGAPLHAETRYVTDQFKITLRSGESSSHRILRMLPSGMPLEVLATNPKTGYSHVRLPDGKEGYVLTRQLLREPVAREQLAALKARIKELETAPGQLSAKLASLQKAHDALKREHQQLQQTKRELEQELASLKRTASNAVRISKERNELRKRVTALTREVEDLKQEKRELENNSAQRWFLIGGGVVVGGILIGLILPNLRVRRKRDSWGSL